MSWWRPDEWSLGYIWRWSDLVQRAILISFALMLGYTFFVVIRFSRHYYLAEHKLPQLQPDTFPHLRRTTSKLIADLNSGLGMLRGIGSAAPLLGLAGSSYGILVGMSFGFSGTPTKFIEVLSARVSAALIWTALGIIVAIPATVSHKLFSGYLEDLSRPASIKRKAGRSEPGSFRFAQMLPLRKRSSALPPYALLALLPLLSIECLYMTLEPYVTPVGLPVRLLAIGPLDGDYPSGQVVVSVLAKSNGGTVFRVNSKEIPSAQLEALVTPKLQRFAEPRALVEADSTVTWANVADVIDRLESLHSQVVLLTVTPARQPNCQWPLQPQGRYCRP